MSCVERLFLSFTIPLASCIAHQCYSSIYRADLGEEYYILVVGHYPGFLPQNQDVDKCRLQLAYAQLPLYVLTKHHRESGHGLLDKDWQLLEKVGNTTEYTISEQTNRTKATEASH